MFFIHASPYNVEKGKFEAKEPNPGPTRQYVDGLAQGSGRRLSLCQIAEFTTEPDIFNMLGEGIAVCHPKDTFNKATGRKVALAAALKAAALDYEDRSDVWAAYLKDVGVLATPSQQN